MKVICLSYLAKLKITPILTRQITRLLQCQIIDEFSTLIRIKLQHLFLRAINHVYPVFSRIFYFTGVFFIIDDCQGCLSCLSLASLDYPRKGSSLALPNLLQT